MFLAKASDQLGLKRKYVDTLNMTGKSDKIEKEAELNTLFMTIPYFDYSYPPYSPYIVVFLSPLDTECP